MIPLDHYRVHAAGFDVVQEGGIVDFLRLSHGRHVAAENRQQDQDNDDPQEDIFSQIVQGFDLDSRNGAWQALRPTYTIRKSFASKYIGKFRTGCPSFQQHP